MGASYYMLKEQLREYDMNLIELKFLRWVVNRTWRVDSEAMDDMRVIYKKETGHKVPRRWCNPCKIKN